MEKQADARSAEIRRTKDTDAPEKMKNAALLFFFQSVLVAALFPFVLGSSGRDSRIVVWRLSLLLCSYFYMAVCVLFAPTRKANLFVTLTYPALLAFVVDAVLSHVAGAVIMYLVSVWIARLFGQALAQCSVSGMSAAAAAATTGNPVLAQEAEETLDREIVCVNIAVIGLSPGAIIPLCIMVPDYTLVCVVVLTAMLYLFLPIAVIRALKPFRRDGGGTVVILGEECGIVNVLLLWYLSSVILFTLSFILLSEVGAMVLLWICVLGLAVFLGYCLRLHALYVHIMRSKPEVFTPPADEVNKKEAAGGN